MTEKKIRPPIQDGSSLCLQKTAGFSDRLLSSSGRTDQKRLPFGRQMRKIRTYPPAMACREVCMRLREDVIAEQEIKKSRFIAFLHPCRSEQEARDFFRQITKLHPNASHHCTAIKIGSLMRSSDDGEPAGTAGRPMLDVLANSEADGLCAMVVRYFGGTLLGKGGLVRAYSSSVRLALDQADLCEVRRAGLWQMSVPYELCGKAEGFLRNHQAEIVSRDYMEQALFCFISEENLQPSLDEAFSGALHCTLLDEIEREM